MIVPAACSLYFFILLPFFRYQLNPDAVAYIAIAEKYAAGDWTGAFNGYWSPLVSWLLAAFISAGVDSLIAFKLVNFIAALSIMVMIRKTAANSGISGWELDVVQGLCFLYAIMHGLCTNTPDVLSAACMLAFTNACIRLCGSPSSGHALIAGLTAALAYYCKHYNLVIGLILFFFCAWMTIRRQGFPQVKFTVIAFLLFFCLCLPWTIGIKIKYNARTFSTASAFNLAMLRKPEPPQPAQKGEAMLNLPYSTYHYTSLEDPTWYPVDSWSPLDSEEDLLQYLSYRVPKNIYYTARYGWHLLLPALLLLALSARKKKLPSLSPSLQFICLVAVIYPLGYWLLITEYRYLIISEVLLVLLVINLSASVNHRLTWLLAAFLAIFPIYTTIGLPDKGRSNHEMARKLNAGNRLSGQRFICSPSAWNKSVHLAFFTRSRLYDSLKPSLLFTNAQVLAERDIHFYLCEQKELSTLSGNYTFVAGFNEYVLVQF